MAAPKGNKYYLMAKNAGRPRIYATPDELWKDALDYFAWCDENPIYTIEYYGKDAIKCKVPHQRPYTWTGLYIWCDVCDLKLYWKRDEFISILTCIENCIYTQKFEGAAVGIFSAYIISRDLGLREAKDIDVKSDGKPIAPQIVLQPFEDATFEEINEEEKEE